MKKGARSGGQPAGAAGLLAANFTTPISRCACRVRVGRDALLK